MTARSISSSCSMLIGGVACRFISPCVRKMGGSPTRRCRSEEADCTSFLSSSPRARSAPLYCGAAKSAGRPAGGGATGGGAGAGTGGGGGGGGGARTHLDRRRGRCGRGFRWSSGCSIDGRHHRGQPPHVGHDAH